MRIYLQLLGRTLVIVFIFSLLDTYKVFDLSSEVDIVSNISRKRCVSVSVVELVLAGFPTDRAALSSFVLNKNFSLFI